jgi:glyoxylase-like metal-dependent hydrolase (beta-lactamase superfamily II)
MRLRESIFVLAVLLPCSVLAESTSRVSLDQLNDEFFKITVNGGWEATVLAFTGSDGLLIVDSGFKNTAVELKEVLDSLDHGATQYLINTHSHKDHTGGNNLLGQSATVIAHEQFRSKLKVGSLILEDYTDDALSDIGIKDEMILYFNDEEIAIKAFVGGHDVTDVIVWFKNSKIAYLGDLAYGMHYPSIDYFTGSLLRYPEVISEIIEYLPAETRIVSGHGRDYSYTEMIAFRDMLVETQRIVAEKLEEGLAAEEIVEGDLLANWESYSHPGMMDTSGYVNTLARNIRDEPVATENILAALYEASKTGDGEAIYSRYQQIKASEAEAYGLNYEHYANIVRYYISSLGQRLARERRFADALSVYRILEEHYTDMPDKATLYDSIGEAHLSLYDFKAAREAFKKVLEFAPDHENAKSRLGLLADLKS